MSKPDFVLVNEGLRQPVRLLICGDREWSNYKAIYSRLKEMKEQCGLTLTVITGGAPGADTMADNAAACLGIDRIIFPANWEGRGKAAGPIRNQKQMVEGGPNLAWAFHKNLKKSKGTLDMVKRLRKAGIKTEVFEK